MSKTKKMILGVSCALLAVVIAAGIVCFPKFGAKRFDLWSPSDSYSVDSAAAVLEKKAGQDFKILQISDTQLFTSGKENKAAMDMVKKLVEEQKPDLVVTVGDNVSGFFTKFGIKQFIEGMEALGVPWAPTFGNHDGEGQADLAWQGEQFMKAKNCLYRPGPSNVSGEGNYIIHVTENGKIIQSLFLLDSHNKYEYKKGGKDYAYIEQDQINWYRWAVKGVSQLNYGSYDPAEGKVVPSMAFFHIALPEMQTALEPYLDENGLGKVPEELGSGEIRERICCPPYNSGFFTAMKEMGSTKDVFIGHDHANDAIVTYDGIRMVYGVKTGPSPHQWNDAVAYGGTLITLQDGTNQVRVDQLYEEKVNS